MRELYLGRLPLIEMQKLLKMLVHHINHPVAQSPQKG